MLAADSPLLTFEMLRAVRARGLPELVDGYLGEPPLISVQKTTLRKAEPSVPGAWHQDGAFMGDVRALNLWLSLSRCGDESPGLDVVPRRLDEFVATETDEAVLYYQVSQRKAEEAAGDTRIVAADLRARRRAVLRRAVPPPDRRRIPAMPNPRFAIENWFFGGSAFPGEFAPDRRLVPTDPYLNDPTAGACRWRSMPS